MALTYARNDARIDIDLLDQMVEAEMAKVFITTNGPVYVVKREDGTSVKYTGSQIIGRSEKAELAASIDADNAAEAALADSEADDYASAATRRKVAVDADLVAWFS